MASQTHANLWNRYMRSYDFLESVDSYVQNLKDILKAVHPTRGMRVLDAGSGTGNLSLLLKSAGAAVTSCDFSQNALDKHRAKDSEAVLIKASLEEPLPFENETFETVVCASVVFTLSEAGCRLAMSEFHRVLKPGGRLVVTATAPHQRNQNLICMHWKSLFARYGGLLGLAASVKQLPALLKVLYYNSCLAKLPDWHGFHRFTEDELKTCISRAGFLRCDIRVTYGGFLYLAAAEKA